MLLPAMFRKKFPDATIGFFLHIPFPSYEVYRLLPRKWRKDILMGIYGSDLIGFHTHDYRSYFLISTLRI
jgi:trehalose 6-phosphate synthase/phosphatase